jgi:hypothetical protein
MEKYHCVENQLRADILTAVWDEMRNIRRKEGRVKPVDLNPIQDPATIVSDFIETCTDMGYINTFENTAILAIEEASEITKAYTKFIRGKVCNETPIEVSTLLIDNIIEEGVDAIGTILNALGSLSDYTGIPIEKIREIMLRMMTLSIERRKAIILEATLNEAAKVETNFTKMCAMNNEVDKCKKRRVAAKKTMTSGELTRDVLFKYVQEGK